MTHLVTMRRSKGERRGHQRGTRKQIRTRGNNFIRETSKKAKQIGRLLQKFAELTYSVCFYLSSQLCLIPISKANEVYTTSSKWKRVIMFTYYSTILATMLHKLVVCYLRIVRSDEVDMDTFLCFMVFWSQLMALSLDLGVAFSPDLAVQVALRGLGCGLVPVAASIGLLIFTHFYFDNNPVLALVALEQAGLFQSGPLLPRWTWQVIFFPLDLYQFCSVFLPFAFLGQLVLFEIQTFRIAICEIRRIPVQTASSRSELEELFLMLHVHLKVCQLLVHPIMVPMLSTMGGSVVFLLAFPLMHSGMPTFFKLVCAYLAFVIMLTLMWGSLDMVKSVRESENLICFLQSVNEISRLDLSPLEKKASLKRAKAMIPVSMPVGNFGGFTLDVPIVIWEEVINQLLFLLSF